MKKLLTVIMLLSCLFLLACNKENDEPLFVASDYSDINNWINVPQEITKEVDVFYLIPTCWGRMSEEEPAISEIDNQILRNYGPLAFNDQANVFAPYANLYAPYYRQVDSSLLAFTLEEQAEILSSYPKADVFAALDYYFENYNNGRPFILAGHSQGSNLLCYVLSEYMKENPKIYKRMICAYVIGYSVTEQFLEENPHLKFATCATDTGVIVSYNTEAEVVEGVNPVLLEGAKAINPINWKTDDTYASKEDNLGTNVFGEKMMNFADAKINLERGSVICSTVNPDNYVSTNSAFPKGMYHSQDYNFYYYNLRQNALDRIQQYLNS